MATRLLLSLLLFSFILQSCNKDGSPSTTSTELHGVFMAGTINDTATVWLKGTDVRLPQKSIQYTTRAYSVFVYGNDVYVAGVDGNFGVYWKNGVEDSLSHNSQQRSKANCVFVSNGDVYITGNDGNLGVYWKNGIEHSLSLSGGMLTSITNSVFVTGSDVYICGEQSINIYGASFTPVATFWKNGVPTLLGEADIASYANAITISNNDVYIAGQVGNYNYAATYWKNGEPVRLSTTSSTATSISVSGSDVYVCGEAYNTDSYQNTYWKNGTATTLGYGELYVGCNSIVVADSVVYIGGVLWDGLGSGYYTATYWKDGVPVPVGPLSGDEFYIDHIGSVVSSIFVK